MTETTIFHKEIEGWDELEEISDILNKSLETSGERVIVRIDIVKDVG